MINRFNHELIEHYNYSITYLDETAKKLGNALYSDKDIIQFINMKKNDEIVAILASKVIDKHFLTLKDIDSVYLYNAGRICFILQGAVNANQPLPSQIKRL